MSDLKTFLNLTPLSCDVRGYKFISGLPNILEIIRANADYEIGKRAVEMIRNHMERVKHENEIVYTREPDVLITFNLIQPVKAPVTSLLKGQINASTVPVTCCLIHISYETEALKRVQKPLVIALVMERTSKRFIDVGITPSFEMQTD